MCFFDQLFPLKCPYCGEEKPLYLYESHLRTHQSEGGLEKNLLRESIQYTMTLMKRWTLASYQLRTSCI